MMSRLLCRSCCAFVLVATSVAASATDKDPVPTEIAQKEATERVRKAFAADFARRDDASRQRLARKLIETGKTTRDPVTRDVLLREAHDLAEKADALLWLFEAINAIAEHYRVDILDLKARSLTKLAPAQRRKKVVTRFVRLCVLLSRDALDRYDFEKAEDVVGLVGSAQKRLTCDWLSHQVDALKDQLKAVRRSAKCVEAAAATLAGSPDDREANEIVGKYLGVVADNWTEALPLLAKGATKEIRAAARLDLEQPKEPPRRIELGNLWWNASDTVKGSERDRFRDRASAWYAGGIGSVGGLERVEIVKRLEDLPRRYLAELGWFNARALAGIRTWGVEVNRIVSRRGMKLHPLPRKDAKASFRLDGIYKRFHGFAALNDTGHEFRSKLTFEVRGDGKTLWRSKPITRPHAAQLCDISVKGVKVLELRASARSTANCHAVWLDAIVTK